MKPEMTRTKYLKSVKDVSRNTMVLKPGSNNKKLGAKVLKGRWKGMPIYSLTLEERATCPKECLRWETCYGNNMPFAHRFKAGDKLEKAIFRDIGYLAKKHPKGFVVRLHILGDFYSTQYVLWWSTMLQCFPELHIWGYTAHDPNHTELGKYVADELNGRFQDRCVIRFSLPNLWDDYYNDRFASPTDLGNGSFSCPEQTNKVASCGACAACWESTKTVFFKEH